MRQFALLLSLLSLFWFAPMAEAAQFEIKKGDAVLEQPQLGDLFISTDNNLTIAKSVDGELFSFASRVVVDEMPSRSIVAGGSTVQINKGSGYNTVVFGKSVKLDGDFANDVYVFCAGTTMADPSLACLDIANTAKIGGDLRVYSDGLVHLGGTIGGNVSLYTNSVVSEANIMGSLSGNIENLEFTGGSIAKPSSYTSLNQAVGVDKLTQQAGLTRTEPETKTESAWGWIISLVATLLFGSLVILFIPTRLRKSLGLMTKQWGHSFFVGLGWIILVPILVVVMGLTVVGWKVAVMFGLLYGITLILSGVMAALYLGLFVLQRTAWWRKRLESESSESGPGLPVSYQVAAMALGTVMITALVAIPFLGGLVGALAFFGLALPALGAFLLKWKEEER